MTLVLDHSDVKGVYNKEDGNHTKGEREREREREHYATCFQRAASWLGLSASCTSILLPMYITTEQEHKTVFIRLCCMQLYLF